MPNARVAGVIAVVAALLLLVAHPRASAEPYLAGYVGAAVMHDKDVASRLALDGVTVLDATLRDVEFDTSVVFGGKVGYFFDGFLGGALLFSTPTAGEAEIDKADLSLTAVGLNLLLRFPLATSSAFPGGGSTRTWASAAASSSRTWRPRRPPWMKAETWTTPTCSRGCTLWPAPRSS